MDAWVNIADNSSVHCTFQYYNYWCIQVLISGVRITIDKIKYLDVNVWVPAQILFMFT